MEHRNAGLVADTVFVAVTRPPMRRVTDAFIVFRGSARQRVMSQTVSTAGALRRGRRAEHQ